MKKYKDYLEQIRRVHLILSGMPGCVKYECYNKYDKAIYNNLMQISIHASNKRIGQGEYLMKSNILALNQYEFMYEKSLKYAHNSILKEFMQTVINSIKELRNNMGVPAFKSKDEVMIVEVDKRNGDYRAIEVAKFEDYDGEYNRLLPVSPEQLFLRSPCFMNSVGDSTEAVKYVKNNIECNNGNYF